MSISPLRSVLTVLPFALYFSIPCDALQSPSSPKDIEGGASTVISRPPNPPVRKRSENQKTSAPKPPKTPAPNEGRTGLGNKLTQDSETKPLTDDMSDEVEDALALGNSARDDKPPRYDDAERAYKLAIKLNPDDFRPYIGLGNIYLDQKKFEGSAKAYKEAVRLLGSKPPPRISRRDRERGRRELRKDPPPKDSVWRTGEDRKRKPNLKGGDDFKGSLSGYSVHGIRSRDIEDVEEGRLYGYLGYTLLQQENVDEANIHLRVAVAEEPSNAQWHALLGYTWLKKKRYFEARKSFDSAVYLEPTNESYKISQQSVTFGSYNELRDISRVYLDIESDIATLESISKEINKQKKKLANLTFLNTPENAEIHLILICDPCEQLPNLPSSQFSQADWLGYVVKLVDKNRVRVLMDFADTKLFPKEKEPDISFIKGFIKAYLKANKK